MTEYQSRTEIIHDANAFDALGKHYPNRHIEMSIDCTEANMYTMIDFYKSYLLSIGYAEASFYKVCREISDEYFWSADQEEKRKEKHRSGNGHQLGTTGIDSEKFTFNIGDYDTQEDY